MSKRTNKQTINLNGQVNVQANERMNETQFGELASERVSEADAGANGTLGVDYPKGDEVVGKAAARKPAVSSAAGE